jgi:sec-independent protein translocase protein TatA
MGEITIILLLALIFLGPKKLPELASGLGKLIREIRKTTADVKNEIQLDEAIRKPLEELREAVTLPPEELKRRDRLRQDLKDLQRRTQEAISDAEANVASAEEAAALEGTGADPNVNESTTTGDTAADQGLSAVTPPPVKTVPSLFMTHPSHVPAVSETNATPPPISSLPVVAGTPTGTLVVPGAAPMGTVAREPSGPVAPPAPPLAAVLAKGASAGSGPVAAPERRAAVPPSGSDFLRSLRAVPEGRKATHGKAPVVEPLGAADRGNTTQALTEADLAAVMVGPPPPPPPPPSSHPPARTPPPPPSSPRLPGATPPKNSDR